MVVMTQYNRVAIRNVTLPSDQLFPLSSLSLSPCPSSSSSSLVFPLTTTWLRLCQFSFGFWLVFPSIPFSISPPLSLPPPFYILQFFSETWIVSDDIDLFGRPAEVKRQWTWKKNNNNRDSNFWVFFFSFLLLGNGDRGKAKGWRNFRGEAKTKEQRWNKRASFSWPKNITRI